MNLLFTVVIIGAAYVSAKRFAKQIEFGSTVQPRRGSRADGEAYYYQVRKEMGIDPYSPAELAQMDAEERYTHDRNAASGAFWSGSRTWIDSYGNVRRCDE